MWWHRYMYLDRYIRTIPVHLRIVHKLYRHYPIPIPSFLLATPSLRCASWVMPSSVLHIFHGNQNPIKVCEHHQHLRVTELALTENAKKDYVLQCNSYHPTVLVVVHGICPFLYGFRWSNHSKQGVLHLSYVVRYTLLWFNLGIHQV